MELGPQESRAADLPRQQPTGSCQANAALSPGGEPAVVHGNVSDHAMVHGLLRAVRHAPSYEDFIAWLDEPSYEPADRLLIKHGQQIVAHAQVLHRTAWFDGVKLPIGGVQDLIVLPECAQLGYDRLLLVAAEKAMRESQAILSIAWSDRPDAFRACGWKDACVWGFSQVNMGDILAHLASQIAPAPQRSRGLKIRMWRHVELDALRTVYRDCASQYWGALYRAEHYWQWLAGRKSHSEILVAVAGRDDWEHLELEPRIVGYAVTRGPKVLELCCLPEYARAAPRLLVRACQDAVERDFHTLTLHTPASDPLHELIVTAGGSWRTDERQAGGALMVKLLDPARWVEAIYPVLRRRMKGAGLARPCQICFDTGQEHYRLVLTRRSSRLVADETAAAEVCCNPDCFSALLLGNLPVSQARDEGRLRVADEEILHKLTVLFPSALFWQSQFDMLCT